MRHLQILEKQREIKEHADKRRITSAKKNKHKTQKIQQNKNTI